jgi:hypothetical protein
MFPVQSNGFKLLWANYREYLMTWAPSIDCINSLENSSPPRFELEAEMDAPLIKARKLSRYSLPRGHAAVPGSGLQGETCKTCRHLTRLQYSRIYLKCGLMRLLWTGGPKTDVRAHDPACRRWQACESSK